MSKCNGLDLYLWVKMIGEGLFGFCVCMSMYRYRNLVIAS